ncbi:MAG: cytochrome P450 [Actinomycetota bacterium]|nr:cytochrome P450 [Actinomycetota bacterium]MDA2972051.1 cytochrome P450 [Actinomycetota bacterium]
MISAADIDLISPEDFARRGHPWEQYEWLRANAPVFRHPEPRESGPGFWALTKYDDVKMVSRSPKIFSSFEKTAMLPDPDEANLFAGRQMMLNMDPPQHDRFKLLVSRGFTPKNAPLLRPRIEQLAREIVDAVIERGECDFVSEIAGRLPSGLIAELMGMPRADGERLYDLTEIMHTNDDAVAPPEVKMAAIGEMLGYAQSVAEHKRSKPGDDLATLLVEAEIDGDRLTDLEFQWFFLLLVNAGGDTTRNLLAAGLQLLFDHPDQRRKLLADVDGLLPTAIEEMLRFTSPVSHFKRTVMEDVEIRGQRIPKGDRVVMFYGSANRDEDVFERPDAFDVARDPNPHVAFGAGGPHLCLGMHVARVELMVMFRELLTRMPHLEPNGPAERMHSSFIAGIHAMPVRF